MTDEKKEYNNLFVTVPAKYAKDKSTVDMWDYTDENNKKHNLATITLPKGTTLPDGVDISYFEFTVHQGQVDPAGQKYPNIHSISFLKESSDGEPWNVKLTRQERIKVDGEWINGEKFEVTCTSEELRAATKAQYEKYKEYKELQKITGKDQNTKKQGASLDAESKDAKNAANDLGHKDPVKEGAIR